MYLNLLLKLNLNLFLSRLMFTFTIYGKSIHSANLKRYYIPCNLKMVDHWVKLSEMGDSIPTFPLNPSLCFFTILVYTGAMDHGTPSHRAEYFGPKEQWTKRSGYNPICVNTHHQNGHFHKPSTKPIGVLGFFVISHCAYFHYSTFS